MTLESAMALMSVFRPELPSPNQFQGTLVKCREFFCTSQTAAQIVYLHPCFCIHLFDTRLVVGYLDKQLDIVSVYQEYNLSGNDSFVGAQGELFASYVGGQGDILFKPNTLQKEMNY